MHVLRVRLFATHVRVSDCLIAVLFVCLCLGLLACLPVFPRAHLFVCLCVLFRVHQLARVFYAHMYSYTDKQTPWGDDVHSSETAIMGACPFPSVLPIALLILIESYFSMATWTIRQHKNNTQRLTYYGRSSKRKRAKS